MNNSKRQMGLGVLVALVFMGMAAQAGCPSAPPRRGCSDNRHNDDFSDFGLVVQFPDRPAVCVPPGKASTVSTGTLTYVLHGDPVNVSVPPKVPPPPENTDWVIGFYVDEALPYGHAFIKIRKYTDPPTRSMWREGWGWYPDGCVEAFLPLKGYMGRDRGVAWNRKLCFRITNQQYKKIHKRIDDWKRSGTYHLFTCNCVTFVYDIAEVIGVSLHLNHLIRANKHSMGNTHVALALAMHRPGNLHTELGKWAEHVDNTNADEKLEVREREDQIIDVRK